MLFTLWTVVHIACLMLAYNRLSLALLISIAIALFSVYVFKSPTYDMLVYINNIESSDYFYEPVSNLFLALVEALSLGMSWLYTLIITLLLLIGHVIGLVRLRSKIKKTVYNFKEIIFAISIVLMSLYFFLGSQNVLRQCISIAFFIFFIESYVGKSYYLSVGFLVLSALSHYGNFPVILLMSFFFSISHSSSFLKSGLIGFLIGLVGVFLLKNLFGSIDYLVNDFAMGEERSSIVFKWLAIAFVVLMTTHLIKAQRIEHEREIKSILGLRCLLLGVLTSLLIFDLNEMFTRIAVNLYALDMILMFLLISSRVSPQKKTQHAIAIFAFTSALAPNVYQILNVQ